MAGYIGASVVNLSTNGADIDGNITISGTVDGRDVAALGTKVDGIEASATADQTKSDIEGLGIDVPAANLTGTVAAARLSTAATQAESDASTKIATTAYVSTKLTTLIGGAPSTLNDLSELATAINNDANYNSTLTTALATKMPKAGGAFTGNVTFGDNNKAIFGAGSDLQIYHDGSNSYVDDAGAGRLYLRGNDRVQIQKYTGEDMITAIADGAVKLYHNNANKLETTSTGVDITGNLSNSGSVTTGGNLHIAPTSNTPYITGGAVSTVFRNNANNASLITILNDGKVGIGNASPTAPIDVRISGASGRIAEFHNTSGFGVDIGSDSDAVAYISGGYNQRLSFKTNAGSGQLDRMQIDASGNVDLVTAGTNLKLYYNAAGQYSANLGWRHLQLGNNGANYIVAGNTNAGGDLSFVVNNTTDLSTNNGSSHNGTEAMIIDHAGNVGMGQASPSGKLHLSAASDVRQLFTTNQTGNTGSDGSFIGITDGGHFHIWNRENTNLNFRTSDTLRMRIDGTGRLLIGGATSQFGAGLQNILFDGTNFNAISYKTTRAATGSNFAVFLNSSSQVCGTINHNSSQGVAYHTTSDYRLKENVVYDWDATTRLKQLKPARFNFISEDLTQDGFMAHEAQEVVPIAVSGTKDGMKDEEYEVTPAVVDDNGAEIKAAVMGTRSVIDTQGMDHSKLVPLLVKTIIELEARITALEA